MHILIVGMPGSGKSTLARHIHKMAANEIINYNDYRDKQEFMNAINNNGKPKVIEGVTLDIIEELIVTRNCAYIFILTVSKLQQVSNLIDRIVKRATCTECNADTSESRAKMLIQAIDNYERGAQEVEELYSRLRGKLPIYYGEMLKTVL